MESSSEKLEPPSLGQRPVQKQLWLHIGFPKTGTTSIQAVLSQASDHIVDSGHLYPRLAGFKNRTRIAHNHQSLFRALTLPGAEDVLSERKIADDDLANALERFCGDPKLRQLIISNESFLENVQLDFARLRQLTSSQPSTVIAYVRCYDQWIESRYAQYVRESRGQVCAMRRFYLGQLEPEFFLRRLQVFRDHLPDCQFVVRSFDAARRGGLVEDFLGQTGIQIDSVLQNFIDAKGSSNRSRLPIVNFFKAYATAGPEGAELADNIEDALRLVGDEISNVPFADKRFGFLSYKLKRKARLLYQTDVKLLRKRFGAQIPAPASLSASDMSYPTRLSKREYDQTLEFFRPYLPQSSVDRFRAAYAAGAKVLERSTFRFLRRMFG
jgi:hypothetical protein